MKGEMKQILTPIQHVVTSDQSLFETYLRSQARMEVYLCRRSSHLSPKQTVMTIVRNKRFGSEHDRLWESGSCESLLQRMGGVRLHNEGWLDAAALTNTAGFVVAYGACCSAVI